MGLSRAQASRPQAFFLDAAGPAGGRFCLFHAPAGGKARAAVLHVHAFAEEMNKARRMVAQQARQLADAGVAVLQIDLLGCGDSAGDFADARWDVWLDDVTLGVSWLRSQVPGVPLWLWGLRAGGLLASAAAQRLAEPAHLLLWQPPASGKLLAQQFLRLRLAADMIGGQAKGAMESVREELRVQGQVSVAGYTVSAGLLAGLEATTLQPPQPTSRVCWLELSSRVGDGVDTKLLPASARIVAGWREQGVVVHDRVVSGPAFWQTTEIEDAPALWEATRQAVLAAEVGA